MSAPARSGPPKDRTPAPAPPPPPTWRRWLLPLGVLLTFAVFALPSLLSPSSQTLKYNPGFLQAVEQGRVESVTVADNGGVTGDFKQGGSFTTTIPTALNTGGLEALLKTKNVTIVGAQSGPTLLSSLLGFLPLLLIVALFVYTGRRASKQLAGAVGGFGGIGRSRARVIEAERPTTRFADVAGYTGVKQEVSEVVDFLKAPERYKKAGAVGPRGVLMAGPPGTGKTLLARAVAGEAEVAFLAVTGSAFVEMFVGVGASRVRDMFAEARKRGPAIIFIDEIDAIGGRRGGNLIGNDEREQTLNQLLAEMDGFDESHDVVVIAATNRPETLDPALLRPGRFDRQVQVPLPQQAERAAILAVHSRGKSLAPDVDLEITARGTPGFSGADLANLVNEAAIVAVRDGRTTVQASDFDAARDRILLGRREEGNMLLPDEKHSVAVHESGHALVASLSEDADPVAKVTILPAGMALGVTEQLPLEERHLHREGYLRDTLAVRLGGRAAELVVFGEGSTGAANDLAGATELATRMVREFGLSPALGPVGYSGAGPQYLGGAELSQRSYSEDTQRVIDTEVSRLLREAEHRAVTMLTDRRDALDALTDLLLEQETVDGTDVDAIAHTAVVEPARQA